MGSVTVDVSKVVVWWCVVCTRVVVVVLVGSSTLECVREAAIPTPRGSTGVSTSSFLPHSTGLEVMVEGESGTCSHAAPSPSSSSTPIIEGCIVVGVDVVEEVVVVVVVVNIIMVLLIICAGLVLRRSSVLPVPRRRCSGPSCEGSTGVCTGVPPHETGPASTEVVVVGGGGGGCLHRNPRLSS